MIPNGIKSQYHIALAAGIISFVLCLSLGQQVFLPYSFEKSIYNLPPNFASSTPNPNMTQSQGKTVTSVSLVVSSIFPPDGTTLTSFPAKLEVKVTRGGFAVQGVRVQFWMMGGSHDQDMHNAFLTATDLSGYAYLTLPKANTLEPSRYMWYANAIQPGYRPGSSDPIVFTIPSISTKGTLSSSTFSGGTVFTDKKEYSVTGNDSSVIISGNVNSYHLGQPIILKITPPSYAIGHNAVQQVAYGTYLGSFQTAYNLGQHPKLGKYTVTVYQNYFISSQGTFSVVK
ncbi:MAG TPA: hypothetical protein VLT10_00595 [Verrucomicrobiae bacterium]|nr:hypothetical protein [Verrucomicrobiae bacterium]